MDVAALSARLASGGVTHSLIFSADGLAQGFADVTFQSGDVRLITLQSSATLQQYEAAAAVPIMRGSSDPARPAPVLSVHTYDAGGNFGSVSPSSRLVARLQRSESSVPSAALAALSADEVNAMLGGNKTASISPVDGTAVFR